MFASTRQYHDVFLVKFSLAMADPDLPQPRYHHVVFVQTNADDGSGVKFHVVGDITSFGGMKYESTEFGNPLDDPAFHDRDLLGFTVANGFRRRWDEVLGNLPTPPKQKEYNMATGRTELVKTWDPLMFYAPGEERRQPWKCTEWTMDHAIPALWKHGLIVDAAIKVGNGWSWWLILRIMFWISWIRWGLSLVSTTISSPQPVYSFPTKSSAAATS